MKFTNTDEMYIQVTPFLFISDLIAMHVDVENQIYFPIVDKVYYQFNPIKYKIQREIRK